MTPDDTAFFRLLGARIAQRRKTQDLTQAELGDLVGVTQQQIASFETGRRRMPISTLPLLAKALSVSIETLLSEDAKPAKRGPVPQIQRQLEQLRQLPKVKQQAIMQVIDSVIAQARL
ncbi:MAG: helix-turn-helix domain-containing protein [Gemmobacter sp.]|nr:helix-turn-helix domain-containing protein [Gemmobacter sp.]